MNQMKQIQRAAKKTTTELMKLFTEANSESSLQQFVDILNTEGYAHFYRLIEGIRQKLRHFTDEQITEIEQLIAKADRIFPKPEMYSPSWQGIWHELAEVAFYKTKVLQAIALAERSGEWQILMDNPITTQEVVCYPNLTFDEAAYLYGYFQPQMVKNEYVRVQKVQTYLMDYGT